MGKVSIAGYASTDSRLHRQGVGIEGKGCADGLGLIHEDRGHSRLVVVNPRTAPSTEGIAYVRSR